MYHTNKNTAHVCHLITTAVDVYLSDRWCFFTILCDENWANSNINVCIISSENWRTNSQWAAVWVSASRNRRDTCFFHSSLPSWWRTERRRRKTYVVYAYCVVSSAKTSRNDWFLLSYCHDWTDLPASTLAQFTTLGTLNSEVGYELVLGTRWFGYKLAVGTTWLGY